MHKKWKESALFFRVTQHRAAVPRNCQTCSAALEQLQMAISLNNNQEIQRNLQKATFSTSVGLAMEEEMTPERTPHITLVSSVSSARREEWEADCDCEQAAFDTAQ